MTDLQRITALELQLKELQQTVRELRAMKQGPKGDPGRDGRDGRDGNSASAQRLMAMMRNANPGNRAPTIHVESATPQIVVQASDVTLEALLPVPSLENHIHVDGLDGLKDIAKATDALTEVMLRPMKPVYDEKGRIIRSERESV